MDKQWNFNGTLGEKLFKELSGEYDNLKSLGHEVHLLQG